MENRRNSRREGGKFGRNDRRDNRRRDDRDNERRNFSKPRRNDDDYDFERKERRKAMRNDNWFDIDPAESRGKNYREEQSRERNNDHREERRNNRNNRNERREERSFDNKKHDNKSRNFDKSDRKRSFRNNESRGDKYDRKYKDYKNHRNYKNYDDDDFDEFDENEYFDTPRTKHNSLKDNKFDHKKENYRNSNKADAPKKSDGSVRLNKYISNAGICSRREADVLIASGAVSVNGEVVTQLGFKVMPGDVVHYGGEKLVSERKRYVLLNKPKGYITTMDDPQERKTVMNLIADACTERIYPVGRLDRNTTGLLLFTNDGELAKKLTHPSTGARKVYHVELDKPLTANDRKRMLEGLNLEDGEIAVDAVEYDGDDKHCVGVEIHSGRNRIVRRIFESMGYEVYKLDRVIFAELTKKNLPRGRYRVLTDKEVSFLKML